MDWQRHRFLFWARQSGLNHNGWSHHRDGHFYSKQHTYSNPNGNAPGSWDNTGEIYKMELDGRIIGRFGHAGKQAGGFQVVHMMDCRHPNEIIVAEIESWRVQKIVLKPQDSVRTTAAK